MNVAVTGWSLHLPGVRPADALTARLGRRPGAWARADAVPADRAADLLGRKGLLGVEPATRLALCAVHRALRLPPGHRPDDPADPRAAVVACGDLGTAEAVARVARAAATEGGTAVSILDAPNVSGNVVAATVAIRYRLGGPNLMVCSGPDAGARGLRLALVLLRAGRADRVVLVGTEPADEVAAALHAADGPAAPLTAGAACVVLAASPVGASLELCAPDGGDAVRIGPGGFDTAAEWGDHRGAETVVGLALAAHLVADEGADAADVHGAARVRRAR
ncbi:beta-ketoacyl synthase N-terminal-like domain-containing protein [Actinomadura opuntiae]|uniref:beta-ketoacyl synthase N-terminal-like domain-containing protein n=1 Tax=Actinomadura sp. OS1-43 TaxID=604315 RepID=UPI00255A7352|nr:beta-ketoacyl synthase N-terminal-like domain-containing protein [Actinomadura sp. OS1-43]MDL4820277.1 beta-ketoacyl synthase N-terminal-like domain-containing protein [Actinomadura sp. OS1-43]